MLKAIDIKAQSFKKGLFGFKTSDVSSFLDTVSKAYDDLVKENNDLADRLAGSESFLQEARLKIFDLENKLQKAENVENYGSKEESDKLINKAKNEAAAIIAKAKEQAESIKKSSKPIKVEPTKKVDDFFADFDSVKSTTKTADSFKVTDATNETKATNTNKVSETPTSATSRFFKKTEETVIAAAAIDDDEIFVGEIEDSRKPDRMMIGDGEEDDLDFEFL